MSTVDHAGLAKLREPFPPEAISKLPKGKEDKSKRARCNTCQGYHDPSMFHLDYVGHAALTDRLLTVDPEWTWEPYATDEHGAPLLDRNQQGAVCGMWIRLTVCGMTRPGYGSCEPGKPDAVKELIGDALRNAGMRFGMALDLWHKGDLPDAPAEPLDLSGLDGLIAEARRAGVDGDYDSLRAWASESAENLSAAESKLRKSMLSRKDSSGGGNERPSDEGVGETPPEEPTSNPQPEGEAPHPDGWDVPPKTDDPPPADDGYDWHADAKARGLGTVDVIKALTAGWPDLAMKLDPEDADKLKPPSRSKQVDSLASKYPELVATVLAETEQEAA